eukprot:354390-Pyramimonas_sp.AAC.1
MTREKDATRAPRKSPVGHSWAKKRQQVGYGASVDQIHGWSISGSKSWTWPLAGSLVRHQRDIRRPFVDLPWGENGKRGIPLA